MSGWLPPGCTDKDIDDAAPREWETLADYLEDRQEAIWLERALHDIRCLCDEVYGRGYHSDLKETLSGIHAELWP